MCLKIQYVIYRILIAFIGIVLLSGCSGPEDKASQDPSEISHKPETLEIRGLVRKASLEMGTVNNMKEAEKLLKIAVQKAESTYDKVLVLNTYNDFIEILDYSAFTTDRLEIAARAEELTGSIENPYLAWRTLTNCCNANQSAYKFDKALDFAYRSHTIAENLQDDTLKILSTLKIGSCLENRNQIVEAFRNYLQALSIADKSGNDLYKARCFNVLAQFYNLRRDFDKSIEYKLKQAEILKSQKKVDSLALMKIIFELEDINNNSRRKVNEVNISALLTYARHSGNTSLWDKTLALYRSYLINSEKFGDLKTFYTKTYPLELTRLSENDPGNYCRVKAFICEVSGDVDSAKYFFARAKELTDDHPNKLFKTNFYIRLGQFYNRHQMNKEAAEVFREAYEIAATTTNLYFTIRAATEMENTLSALGEYKEALSFAQKKEKLSDSLVNSTKKDELLLLEIDNTARMRDEALARKKEAEIQRHNLQYTAIVVAMVVVFVLVIILGSFRVPKWTIHFAGFFSLIFLFEFLILLIDEKIHTLTHGEPWKVLSIKIILLCILLPVHQYAEKRVINYLLNHRLLHFSSFSLRKFLKDIFLPHHMQG